jgi:5'-3' exoribonuclease 1
MVRLHEHLKYFVVTKINSDEQWQNVNVYLSGHDVRFSF